jgi:hypothetical protein
MDTTTAPAPPLRKLAVSVTTIKQVRPTYLFATIDFDESEDGQAVRASYRGVKLEVEYGQSQWIQSLCFRNGSGVEDDWAAMTAFVDAIGASDETFMCSSMVDAFLSLGGYQLFDREGETDN